MQTKIKKILKNAGLFSLSLLFFFAFALCYLPKYYISVAKADEIESNTVDQSKYLSSALLQYLNGAVADPNSDTFDFFQTTPTDPNSDIIYDEYLILYDLDFYALPNGGYIYFANFSLYDRIWDISSSESVFSLQTQTYFDYTSLGLTYNGMSGFDENLTYVYQYYTKPSLLTSTDYSSLIGGMFYFDSAYYFNNGVPLADGKPFISSGYFYLNGAQYSLSSYFGNPITYSDVSPYMSMKFITLSSLINYAVSQGFDLGYSAGSSEGYDNGYDAGYSVGSSEGYDKGYDSAFNSFVYFPFYNSSIDLTLSYYQSVSRAGNSEYTESYYYNSNPLLSNGVFYLNSVLSTYPPIKNNGDIVSSVTFDINLTSDFIPDSGLIFTYSGITNLLSLNLDLIFNFTLTSNFGNVFNLEYLTEDNYVFLSTLQPNEKITKISVVLYNLPAVHNTIDYVWSDFSSCSLIVRNSFNASMYDFYYNKGQSEGFNSGFVDGYKQGKEEGFDQGYAEGLTDDGGLFYSLISAVFDVPVSTFVGLFNFEIMGVNMSEFFLGLLGVVVIFAVLTFFMRFVG